MVINSTTVRVRYSETDQMGYVYYGNYAAYYEVGRVETLRKLGINYRDTEMEGVMLPVVDYKIRYFKPAHYDDELTIVTSLKKMPTSAVTFHFETYRDEVLLNSGEVTLVFVSTETKRPVRCPEKIAAILRTYFTE